jgi:chromosome segregation ATPase
MKTASTIESELSKLDQQREEIARKAKAEADAIVARQNELRRLQEPLGRMLPQREELVRKIHNGQEVKAFFEREIAAFQSALDDVFSLGVNGGAVGSYLNILRVRQEQAEARRAIFEVSEFLARRQAELEDINPRIIEYARQHKLEYMLPPELVR